MADSLTKEQAIIISGYTGVACCLFSDLHKDVENRLGHPIFTHEFVVLEEKIKECYKEDFLKICYKGDNKKNDKKL